MIGGTSPWGSGSAMQDVGETSNWCEQRCINTGGGYKCGCLSGYSLQGDNVTCSGKLQNSTYALRKHYL